ncbi:MAG: permease [bacterium]|jgi:uncharacterized membrane protein YraQ (UPF0718 family)|nr:permease [bacterium]MDD5756619.1 permease [bacterium]
MTIFLIIATITIIASFFADRQKTLVGIKKGLKMFINLLPALLNILVLVSIVLYLLPKETLVKWLGHDVGGIGISVAAILGSISLIPGFIAFPLGGILLKSGVSYQVIAVFITTLMMVGVLTLPLEAKYFGMRVALLRNALSFIGAVLIGIVMGILI